MAMEYALIKDGRVVNIAIADAKTARELPGTWVPAAGAGIGWLYADGVFTPPASEQPTEGPPEAGQRITRLAFRKRFTQAEKVMLELAALDDPAAPQAQRANAAAMRAYLKDVDAAQFIDLADAHTVAGVQALENAGLLADGRADEILSQPVQPDEAP